MTLSEAFTRMKRLVQVGDHEIVRQTCAGSDGLAHLIVVVNLGTERIPALSLMVRCRTLAGATADDLEIAPFVTCVECARP